MEPLGIRHSFLFILCFSFLTACNSRFESVVLSGDENGFEQQDLVHGHGASIIPGGGMNAIPGGTSKVSNATLALGLDGVNDWGPQMPFLDLMKIARPWFGQSSGQFMARSYEQLRQAGVLDQNRWPRYIPNDLNGIATVWDWDSNSGAASSRIGTYQLTYEGEGDIELSGDTSIVSQSRNRIVFRNARGDAIGLKITMTDPRGAGDYIRNIRIVREDWLGLYNAGEVFNPQYLAILRDLRQIRFMDWMHTNNSTQSDWADRPKPSDFSWGTEAGVPLETMVRLANQIQVNPWFSLPLHASDNYIRQFALYIRDNLHPGLVATIELSNETWNYSFQQTQDLSAMAGRDWGDSDFGATLSYYTKRATNMALIFDSVFGSQAKARLVKTLATQTGNPWVAEQLVNADKWFVYEPNQAVNPATVFDALAVTTYFGGAHIAEDALRAQLINAIRNSNVDAQVFLTNRLLDSNMESSIPRVAQQLRENKAVAQSHGLRMICYEGGQHVHHLAFIGGISEQDTNALTNFMISYVRSRHMATLYERLWDIWESVGDGPFMQFGSVSSPSRWGSFSPLSHLEDNNPRAEFLFMMNRTVRPWWSED